MHDKSYTFREQIQIIDSTLSNAKLYNALSVFKTAVSEFKTIEELNKYLFSNSRLLDIIANARMGKQTSDLEWSTERRQFNRAA
jgi:hypothetical protein